MLYLPILVPKYGGKNMVSWGASLLHIHIGSKFSCPILAPKLVGVTLSLRPEDAFLVLTLQKLVCLKNLYSVLL